MNIKNLRARVNTLQFVLISVNIMILIILVSNIILSNNLIKNDKFLTLAVLSNSSEMDNYYPNDNQNIEIEDQMKWFIHVYNNMDKSEYISIRIKLLNSTMMTPNSSISKPSPYLLTYDIEKILLPYETWIKSLDWKINELVEINDSIIIKNITVNGEEIKVNVISHDNIFRLVIELWTWNKNMNDFIFGWRNDKSYGPWNQLWFSINT